MGSTAEAKETTDSETLTLVFFQMEQLVGALPITHGSLLNRRCNGDAPCPGAVWGKKEMLTFAQLLVSSSGRQRVPG